MIDDYLTSSNQMLSFQADQKSLVLNQSIMISEAWMSWTYKTIKSYLSKLTQEETASNRCLATYPKFFPL